MAPLPRNCAKKSDIYIFSPDFGAPLIYTYTNQGCGQVLIFFKSTTVHQVLSNQLQVHYLKR